METSTRVRRKVHGMTKYAMVSGLSEISVASEDAVALASDAVEVAIKYCGICATDTHNYTGGGTLAPSIFGHEWTGTISRVGSDVTDLQVGQRVLASVGPSCGECAMCRANHTEQCESVMAEQFGVLPDAPAHGGFAETIVVNQRRVMAVLDELSDVQAALVEPTAVTFHAVRRTHQAYGSIMVVQGLGPIGLLTAQHARNAGSGVMLLVEPNPERRRAAEELGFTEVFEPGEAFEERLKSVSKGTGADVLYECTGAAGLFQASAALVRRGGTLALLGFPSETSEVSYQDWQLRELRVVGSIGYTHDDFLGAQRSIANGSVKVEGLHTGTIGLDDLAATLDELDSGKTSHAKVLVDPHA